jgi:hypothetical protein
MVASCEPVVLQVVAQLSPANASLAIGTERLASHFA